MVAAEDDVFDSISIVEINEDGRGTDIKRATLLAFQFSSRNNCGLISGFNNNNSRNIEYDLFASEIETGVSPFPIIIKITIN